MTQTAKSTATAAPSQAKAAIRPGAGAIKPFVGVLEPVLVEEPVLHSFSGSLGRAAAMSAWTWVVRDLCADLIPADGVGNGSFGAKEFDAVVPEVLARMKIAMEASSNDVEAARRLRAQIGRDDSSELLAVVQTALRSRVLLVKAVAFGKALNRIGEDSTLASAIQTMPIQDAKVAALLFHAMVGQITNPTRLITVLIKLAGNANEQAMVRAGFAPVIEAYLAHAQNQIHTLQLTGPFADIDLACRSLDRFHRLVRALTGYIEFARGSRASQVLSTITKHVSDRVEPRLREVGTDLNQALRRPREGADRLDNDRLLAAINGVFLLTTVRDCRDSLALNAVFDQAWSMTGQALELHIQRNIDLLRQGNSDTFTNERLDAAIKMAELRFNPEYAETLRRSRQSAERRT